MANPTQNSPLFSQSALENPFDILQQPAPKTDSSAPKAPSPASPKAKTSSSTGKNKETATQAEVHLKHSSGRYRIGRAQRPVIKWDNGHLDHYPKRNPEVSDQLALTKWITKLRGAQLLRPDLKEATDTYEHFLFGSGKDRTIDYEKYLREDSSGRSSLNSLQADFMTHIEIIGDNRERFEVTGEIYHMGADPKNYPYPSTENWQKAIGSHVVWISANVGIALNSKMHMDEYTTAVTLHMEDRYNFNPGGTDVKTGIPDSENGRFELTGLGHQYTNKATLQFVMSWLEGKPKTLKCRL